MPRTGETRGSEEQRVVRDELDRPCRPVVRHFALTLRPRVWARRLISGYRPTLSQGARDSRWTARDQPHRSFPLRTQPLRTGLNPGVRAYRDCSRVIRLPALHTPDGRGRLYSSRFVQIQRCSIWGRYCEFGRFAPPVKGILRPAMARTRFAPVVRAHFADLSHTPSHEYPEVQGRQRSLRSLGRPFTPFTS